MPRILWYADTFFYVGTLKGVGRIYQQTVTDTYSNEDRSSYMPESR